ncbi:uridine kinase [Sinanaerobacter chloroacetimidivorans]|jgi:uridine kinase|uniref:Uridine kinase n=1 Tax=Sinanaerobacter chloroacetimidivorans TaxID=2818044 RepID=A0A8J7W0T9_9FIRM|nr:uridine kinase [Sinanaerobacter chloroacetimidivorans]MBR0597135.1 uridine kinase [Sinanaerobacter chloroacetimidivorans]
MSKAIIIGIAGGTGSGKTTMINRIKKEFNNEITILSHDFYYKENSHLPFEEREKLNYDHPNSFDTDLMVEHIKQLRNGDPVERPVYDFVIHNRKKETVTVQPARVIIVEGILIFENKDLMDLFDIKVFIDTDPDVRIIRRILRDVRERGRSLDSVINQYMTTVKLMHEQFVEPSKKNADIIIPEGGYNIVALQMLNDRIKSLLMRPDGQ